MAPEATGKNDQPAVLARWQETRSPRLADLLCCVDPDPKWKRLAAMAAVLPSRR